MRGVLSGGRQRGKNWDNCNSINNKIQLKKEKMVNVMQNINKTKEKSHTIISKKSDSTYTHKLTQEDFSFINDIITLQKEVITLYKNRCARWRNGEAYLASSHNHSKNYT